MTDFQLHDLDPIEDLNGTEIAMFERNPTNPATRALKKITAGDMLKRNHGHIYAPDVSPSAQTIPAATWTKVVGYTQNGLNRNCTADAASGLLTPQTIARWLVGFHVAWVGEHGSTYKFAIFKDGSQQAACQTQFQLFGTFGQVAATGFIDVDPTTVDIDLRVYLDGGGTLSLKDSGIWTLDAYPHT